MHRKLFAFLTVAALAAALLLPQRPASAQDPGMDITPGQMAEMMAQMEKLAAPGEMHELLATLEGEWDLVMEYSMSPDAEPEKSAGRSRMEMVLGGRYLREELSSEVMGMAFAGINHIGYDNAREEFHSTWIDTGSTWPTTSTGSWDAETRTLTTTGLMRDVADLDGRPFRHAITWESPDRLVARMYDTIPPVGEVQVMTITYTRKG